MQPFSSAGLAIRAVQRRDLEELQRLQGTASLESHSCDPFHDRDRLLPWHAWVRVFGWLPDALPHAYRVFVAEVDGRVEGFICVSPVNRSRTTWRIDRIAVADSGQRQHIGSQLVRHSLEACWEARTWVVEVESNLVDAIALYRQNGFQPLAQLTDWELSPAAIAQQADRQPDLPNLLPISNTDASLLYQLDTAAMPPQIRQVYDLSTSDFRISFFERLLAHSQQLVQQTQEVSAYVYEPQRKAAIGYFCLRLSCPRARSEDMLTHIGQLTVHPAYTWLYPELIAKIAQIIRQQAGHNSQLLLSSADYQPEREAYLEQIVATRVRHSLLMARSVWHKVRETRPALDSLQLAGMLSRLQPAQKPVPGRINTPPHHSE